MLTEKQKQLKNYKGDDMVVSSQEIEEDIKNVPENPVKISTGFKNLDYLLGKIEGGEMIAITGKTKRGKSLIIKSMLSNLANNGHRAVIFQYEIPYRRYFESWGGNPPLFYLPKHLRNRTSRWLEERVIEAKLKYGINVVVIDPYNKLVNYEQKQSPTVQASAIVGNLKDICTTHNIIMFVVSHASRIAEGGTLNENIFRDCLPKGQLIYNSNGSMIPIEKIKEKDKIVSKGSSFSIQNDIVKHKWNTGIKKVYRVTTKTGCVLDCTDKQKFYSYSGKNVKWAELKDLSVGKKIAIVKKYPEIKKESITPEQAILLGWIIGDGHINKEYSTEITVNTKKECLFLKNLADKAFDLNCRFTKYKNKNAYRFYLTHEKKGYKWGIGNKNNKLAQFLKNISFNPSGKGKYVPDIIFKQSDRIIGKFLSGLFHADGCVIKARSNNSLKVELDSTSKKLAKDVHHLLKRLGIISYYKEYKMKNFSDKLVDNFRVYITNYNIIKFKELIGFYCDKQNKFNELFKKWKPKSEDKLKGNFYFDKIKSIEYLGKKETWDIQVKGKHKSLPNHTYCANDILTHNTHILPSESDRSWIVDRVVDKQTKQFTNETKLIISLDRWEGSAMGKIVTFEYKDGLLYEKELLSLEENNIDEDQQIDLPF